MDFCVIAQDWLTNNIVASALLIICLAIVIWLLSWLLFPEPEAVSVAPSLSGLPGLDEQMAAKLRKYGIHSDRDLMRVSARAQHELESELGLRVGEFKSWRASILQRWRTKYLPPQLRDSPDVYPDPELGALYASKPSHTDDLSKLRGIDQLTANRLHAAGIYTREQLRLMTPEQRASFKRRFKLSGFNFDHLAATLVGGGGTAASLTAQASESGPIKPTFSTGSSTASREPASRTSDQTTPPASSGTNASGTRVASLTGDATVATTENSLHTESISRMKTNIGSVYTAPPAHQDDLTKLEGIDPATSKRMNEAGIYRFDQLTQLTPEQQRHLRRRFSLPSVNLDRWKSSIAALGDSGRSTQAISPTTSDSGSAGPVDSAATSNSGASSSPNALAAGPRIPTSKIDAQLGRVYTSPPPHRDDLTELPGIDTNVAQQLNAVGIYTIDQLQSLSPAQQSAFKRRFGLPNVDFAQWRIARGDLASGRVDDSSATSSLAADSSGTSSSATDSSGTAARVSKSSAPSSASSSTDRTNRSAATTSSGFGSQHGRDIGYIYGTPPIRPDDLTQLEGVDSATAKRLNEAGIYKLDQLNSMNPTQQQNFKSLFGLGGLDFATWLRNIDAKPPTNKTSQNDPATHQAGSKSVSIANAAVSAGVTAAGAAAVAKVASLAGQQTSTATTDSANDSADNSATNDNATVVGFAAGAVLPNTTSDLAHPASSHIASSPTRTDTDLGLVYDTAPKDADDLTQLLGIDAIAAQKLNAAGIYRYAQIHAWDDHQRNALKQRLGLPEIDFSDWSRCINAWSRGIMTKAHTKRIYPTGWLHGVRLPQIAAGVFDGQQLVAYREQVVFRGSDPRPWGTHVPAPQEGVTKSLPATDVRSDINYVRIRRVDTRASVVTPITKGQLFGPGSSSLPNSGPSSGNGWNGLCETFFGGRHLGIFAADVPNEVETKFGIGGWGFGHRFDHNDQQEWAWHGRLIEPTAFEISVGQIGAQPGTSVFRSSDPAIWNTKVRAGFDHWAVPVTSVTHPVAFIRLVRVDTGEGIIVRTEMAGILSAGHDPVLGWNGLNEHFTGGYHLGVYHADARQDVEIRFGDGGWGFGHPFDDNDHQAYGWAGSKLPETVFEISLLENIPEYLRHELME